MAAWARGIVANPPPVDAAAKMTPSRDSSAEDGARGDRATGKLPPRPKGGERPGKPAAKDLTGGIPDMARVLESIGQSFNQKRRSSDCEDDLLIDQVPIEES